MNKEDKTVYIAGFTALIVSAMVVRNENRRNRKMIRNLMESDTQKAYRKSVAKMERMSKEFDKKFYK